MKQIGMHYSPAMRMALMVALTLSASCTKSNPAASCEVGSCIDPDYPYCDADGSISGVPGACIALSCIPGKPNDCSGDMLQVCNETGNGYQLQPCDLGCSIVPEPHCKYLQPHFTPDACDVPAASPSLDFANAGSFAFDPSVDANCTGGVIQQAGAPAICVVHYGEISVGAGSVVAVLGSKTALGRSIAFVADHDLSVNGTLDVGAHSGFNGPGGGMVASGGAIALSGDAAGGAGGATAGGAGATATTDGGANNGGPVAANPALLDVLIGGASAARGAQDADEAVYLGGGGGAVSLVSCSGKLNVTGIINAGGGGGHGGFIFNLGNKPEGGMGGGAGGFIALQAPTLSVTGQLFANGGGGGAGALADQVTEGNAGEDANMSDTALAHGGLSVSGNGQGGNGGIQTGGSSQGFHPTTTGAAGGGGGGGVGFLQTYTPSGVTPTVTPSHISPPIHPNAVALTR